MDYEFLKSRANLLRQIEIVVDSEIPFVDTKDRYHLVLKLADKVTENFPQEVNK